MGSDKLRETQGYKKGESKNGLTGNIDKKAYTGKLHRR